MKKTVIILVSFLISMATSFGQTPIMKMPFELFGNHIIIKIRINNSEELEFIFDTGDGLTVLDIDKAAKLGLVADGIVKKTSAGGKVTGVLLKHQKIEIGSEEIADVEIYETSLLSLERSIGRPFDGIIGYDILKNFTVRVDYDAMMFELYSQNDKSFKPRGTSFPLLMVSYIPIIKAKFQLANGETINGNFFIDCGARAAVDLNSPIVNEKMLIDKLGKSYQYSVVGIGNEEIVHYKGLAENLVFGKYQIATVPLGLSQATQGIQSNKKVAGIFGNDLLKKFNATYDYKGKKIYFEENKNFNAPFEIDACGIDFQLDNQLDNILIHQVHENTPAASAGIQIDAQLLSVDGVDAKTFSFPELRNMLSKDGETVTLTVLQKGETKDITIKLETLL